MSEGGPREVRLPSPPGGPLPWLVGAGVIALAVLAVASASGPVPVVTTPPSRSQTSDLVSLPPATSTTRFPHSDSSLMQGIDQLPSLPPVVVLFIQVLVFGLVAWLVSLLVRWIWRHFPRWRARIVAPAEFEALPSLPDDLLETADQRLRLLQQGTPRNAIVACWVDLEDSASAVGLPRWPAETSAEYTVRVLRTWDVAPDAMGRLAELYREARHSTHELTEEHRDEAVRRLEAIHDDLRRIVAAAHPTTDVDGMPRDAARGASR